MNQEQEPNQIALTSPDGRKARLAELRRLLPDLFDGEGVLDGKALRQLISEEVGHVTERFSFEWAGKAQSKRFAFAPSKATLIYDPTRSVNADGTPSKAGETLQDNTSQNLIIEGDNLEVLKLLQTSYLERVNLIYIDPPYNTGSDFIYPDDYSQTREEYWKKSGQKIDGVRLKAVTEASGKRHSDWLSFMLPRLLAARTLMSDDAICLISIDENEVVNLQKLCEEVFGENNVLGNFPVIMNLKGNQDAFGFAETHEYFIVCMKDRNSCEIGVFDIDEEAVLREWEEDDHGLFKEADNLRATGVNAPRTKRQNLWYPIFINTNTREFYAAEDNKPVSSDHEPVYPINPDGEELSWYWSKKKLRDNHHNIVVKYTSNGWQFYKKQRPQLGELPTKKPKSVFYKSDYSTSTATTQLKKLMGVKLFEGPKPVPFLLDLISIGTKQDALILDFFAGSGSLAEAVMQKNKQDGGRRRYICVQIPELLDESSEAFKAGYKTISAITYERVKRAGIKIATEGDVEILDIGYRAFQLTGSNFVQNTFIPDPNKSEADNLSTLEDHLQAAAQLRLFGDDDFYSVVTEIALKNGFGLFYTLERQEAFSKNMVYRMQGNDKEALLCLDGELNGGTIEALKAYSDDQLIVLKAALDTTKKFELQTAFKDNLWVV